MEVDFSAPIVGADEALISQLINEKIARKKAVRANHPPTRYGTEERRQTRYDVAIPAVCFPLFPSLEVNIAGRIDGLIVDISDSGLGITLADAKVQSGQLMLIGAEPRPGEFQFIDLRVCRCQQTSGDSAHVNGVIDTPLGNFFSEDLFVPALDAKKFKFTYPYSDAALASLCAIGAAERIVLDEVLVCPDCLAIPTVRKGCSICLSHETEATTMIHHFACANVDYKEKFDQNGEIVCPKCLGRKMIIGADYEYLDGPVQCRECGHNDLEEILIGHCMNCSNRFPFEQAVKKEIFGYRVNRLVPLALLD